MSSKDAYKKAEELYKLCDRCKTDKLKEECKNYTRDISLLINNIYVSAEDCRQSILEWLYILGNGTGKILQLAREYFDHDLEYEIHRTLAEFRKVIYNDIGQILQEKCRCRLR